MFIRNIIRISEFKPVVTVEGFQKTETASVMR